MNSKKIILPGFLWALFILCSGYFRSTAQTPDPGLMGPHAVIKAEYNLGTLSYAPPSAAMFPGNMEEIGSVHYPADLASGPFDVILFLHGRHETCYDSVTLATSSAWPCTGRNKSIPSYEGYDYLAKTLASNGYIVISISANAINAIDGGLTDAGMDARGVLVQHHLDLWNTWNTVGGAPFGTLFKGRLNMQNVGTMGHSRGGEGVIYNAEYNRTLGSPYGIRAIFTLAPVDFFRHFVNGIPLLDLSPYCDGDVSDDEGVHFYDDARYPAVADSTPKHIITMMGANHDYFNTIWTQNALATIGGGADDWLYGFSNSDPQCGESKPTRFDSTKQKAALNAYLPAFFRVYLGNETKFNPILEVNDIVPPASSTLADTQVYVSYHPGSIDRLDVNRIDQPSTLTTNTLTGAVTNSGLVGALECGGYLGGESDCSIGASGQEPHYEGLSGMKVQWNDTFAWYQNKLPVANEDLSKYQNLIFRACVNFAASPAGVDQNFKVQLIDSAGDTSSQVVTNHSHALYFQPGTQSNDLPKASFNTISIPLSGFTGVKLTQIRYIRFLFDQQAKGAVLISDLAVSNPICGNLNAVYKDSVGKKYKVVFTNQSTSSIGDTVSWYWNFGDLASGTKDTSTLQNPPAHVYTSKGTYTACLSVKTKRTYGLSCTDTFCTTIVLATDEVTQLYEDNITIVPNPAKDYLQITGAANTDVLKLMNLYGQVVFTSTISDPIIHLPQTIATGIYYAIIITDKGNVYKKLLITR